MQRDQLFLLAPGFPDRALGADHYICSECAAVEGLLGYFPEAAKKLEVQRIAFKKPRQPVVDLLGSEQQGCPVLVVAEPTQVQRALLQQSPATQRWFASGLNPIAAYLSANYGIAKIHP